MRFLLLPIVVILTPLMAAEPEANNPHSPNAIVPQPAEQSDNIHGVQWGGLLRDSFFFASVQHAFRLATEPGTREGMRGAFWAGYSRSVRSLHGWSDGDPFYVNYIGHPMQGAVSGFIWNNNDTRYRHVTFGKNAAYWRSRLRAMGFSWAYSTLFEIGPYSEATIGKIQETNPQQGLVDHVVTPTIGTAWMIGEDALDRYLVLPLENRIDSRWGKLLVRGFFNPARSFANVMSLKVPWHRNDRGGVGFRNDPWQPSSFVSAPQAGDDDFTTPTWQQKAPFELYVYPQYGRLYGSSLGTLGCAGGGAEALFNLSHSWGIAADVSGCKLLGMPQGLSGDDLLFLTGPRYSFRNSTRFSPFAQLMVGGRRLTMERTPPPTSPVAPAEILRQPVRAARFEPAYQDAGFALAGRAGLEMVVNRAATLRLANLEYTRSWMSPDSHASVHRGVRFTVGFQLRTGTW